jgi:hypothetical protein
VIARLEDEKIIFDPRTVLLEQEPALIAAIGSVVNTHKKG